MKIITRFSLALMIFLNFYFITTVNAQAPGSAAAGHMNQAGPGSAAAGHMNQAGPGSAAAGHMNQGYQGGAPGSAAAGHMNQAGPGSAAAGHMNQAGPGSAAAGHMNQGYQGGAPGSAAAGHMNQAGPGSAAAGHMNPGMNQGMLPTADDSARPIGEGGEGGGPAAQDMSVNMINDGGHGANSGKALEAEKAKVLTRAQAINACLSFHGANDDFTKQICGDSYNDCLTDIFRQSAGGKAGDACDAMHGSPLK
jgi:hypothetical protein